MPSKQDLLGEIRRLAAVKDLRPTLSDLKEDGEFSKSPYYTEFGSWNAAVQAAGIDGPDPREYDISDEKLLAELRDVADEHGGSVSRSEFERKSAYSRSTYEKRFGNWNDALREAGLPVNRASAVEVICDECGDAFERPRAHLDRDWTDHIFCSEECHGEWREGRIKGEKHPQFDPEAHDEYGANWEQFREKVIERDGGQCVRCGLSRESHQQEFGRDLHVHHIIPRSEFDDVRESNTFENTVTVCIQCHRYLETSGKDIQESARQESGKSDDWWNCPKCGEMTETDPGGDGPDRYCTACDWSYRIPRMEGEDVA
jgi:hypothetical protein